MTGQGVVKSVRTSNKILPHFFSSSCMTEKQSSEHNVGCGLVVLSGVDEVTFWSHPAYDCNNPLGVSREDELKQDSIFFLILHMTFSGCFVSWGR